MAKGKGVELTESDLNIMKASVLYDFKNGDMRTGAIIVIDGIYQYEYLPYSEFEIATKEQSWVRAEMENATIEIQNHEDGGARAKGSLPAWRAYRNALRDYVQSGVVVGERPVSP